MTAPRPAGDAPMDPEFVERVEEVEVSSRYGVLGSKFSEDHLAAQRTNLWSWHVAQVAAAREAAIRECVAYGAELVAEADRAGRNAADKESAVAAKAVAISIEMAFAGLRALLPSPVAGDAPGADTTEGGKDG